MTVNKKNMVWFMLAVIAVVFQNGKIFVPSLTFDGNAKSLRISLRLYRSSLVVLGLGLKCFQLQTRQLTSAKVRHWQVLLQTPRNTWNSIQLLATLKYFLPMNFWSLDLFNKQYNKLERFDCMLLPL